MHGTSFSNDGKDNGNAKKTWAQIAVNALPAPSLKHKGSQVGAR